MSPREAVYARDEHIEQYTKAAEEARLLADWLPGAIPRALVVFNKQDLISCRRWAVWQTLS